MTRLFLLVFLLINVSTGWTQQIDAFIQEINFSSDGFPRDFVVNGDLIYLIGRDGNNGEELWVTDGTQDGTRMVKNIGPDFRSGLDNTELNQEAILDGVLYFAADDDVNGYELWRSDGTEAGTFMVKNLNSDDNSSFNEISPIFRIGDLLVFSQNDPATGRELYVSDGTEAGTQLLKDINPGVADSFPNGFFYFNNELFFSAFTETQGFEMWKTDGTEEGTVLFYEFRPGSFGGFGPAPVVVAETVFYFGADDGTTGGELWKSDGTVEGTQLVKDINPGESSSISDIFGAHIGDDRVVFGGFNSDTGSDPWITDGTEEGTQLIVDLDDEFGTSMGGEVVAYNGEAYFAGADSTVNYELWKTDGTEEGTVLVKDINPGPTNSSPQNFYVADNGVYFSARPENDSQAWFTNGTTAGTYSLNTNAKTPASGDFDVVTFDGLVYFSLDEPLHGEEIWRSNGTPSTTRFQSDLNLIGSGTSNELEALTVGNRLYYAGYNEQVGNEPHFITQDQIVLIEDINPGFDSSITNDSPRYTRMGLDIFFFARTEDSGFELFKMNLQTSDAQLVKDINPGDEGSISDLSFLITYEDAVYFAANDGNGEALWRSDGTEDGTLMVKDISSLNEGGIGNEAVVFNGLLYFQGRESGSTSLQLYRTDGTEDGTELFNASPGVITIRADEEHLFFAANNDNSSFGAHFLFALGTDDIVQQIGQWDGGIDSNIRWATMNDGSYYFVGVNQDTFTKSIIKTDGTPNAAEIIYQFPEGQNEDIDVLFTCGDYVYFLTETSPGGLAISLFRTDGTVEGTIVVDEDMGEEDFFSFLKYTCSEGILFYQREIVSQTLHSYTGNPESLRTHPINADIPFELIRNIFSAGGYLYLNAFSERHGNEIYVAEQNVVLSTEDPIDLIEGTGSEKLFILHPNPAMEYIEIQGAKGALIDQVSIHNLLGQELLVARPEQASDDYTIPISTLPQGIFLVNIQSRSGDQTIKLIKN